MALNENIRAAFARLWEYVDLHKSNVSHTHEAADITNLLDQIYPIGSIYLTLAEISPATQFGGTWELVGVNKVLIGAGDRYAVNSTGGSETHTHTTALRFASYYNEMFMENHDETGMVIYGATGTKSPSGNTRVGYTSADNENNYYNASTEQARAASGQVGIYETEGNTSYTNSIPPYLAVYFWNRIA